MVDDEALAREHLAELLARVPWARNLGVAADGVAAVEAVNALRPDVVFLDVEMPELSGMQVAERLAYPPALVFTTAFDRYALAAFDLEAVDYLLKPFGWRRFLAALERARRATEDRRARLRPPAPGPAPEPGERGGPLERLLVRGPGGIVPVPVSAVERLQADDDYVAVHADGRRHLIAARLGDLARQLDPQRFVRIHRSHVVNWDFVASLVPYDAARFQVRMKDGTAIVASRSHSQALRRIIA